MTSDHRERARGLLADVPGRATRTRIAVLAYLLSCGRASSHAEIQRALPDLDRVSLYRSLDWLDAKQLVERLVGPDGTRRYASRPRDGHAHPHFNCTACGTVICLHDVTLSRPEVPGDYRVEDIAVTIRGVCPACL